MKNTHKRGKAPVYRKNTVPKISEFEGPPHKVVCPPQPTPNVGPTAQPRGGVLAVWFPDRPRGVDQ